MYCLLPFPLILRSLNSAPNFIPLGGINKILAPTWEGGCHYNVCVQNLV